MYQVYVLKSTKYNYFYKGITNNLNRRLREHQNGLNQTTKPYAPFGLVLILNCATRTIARNVEKFFKSGKGREIIKQLAGMAEWYTLKS